MREDSEGLIEENTKETSPHIKDATRNTVTTLTNR
jgi:hypothetical protein